MNLDKSISIIGCGISGIFAALHLKKAGLKNIRLFDKSRGVGGRLATRRSSEGKFDHGAQYLKLDDIYDLPLELPTGNFLDTGTLRNSFFTNPLNECNYSGDTSNYLDKWFGTMHDGSDESHRKMLSRLKLS